MWDNTKKHLGTLVAGKTKKTKFKRYDDDRKILKIRTSCSCIKANFNSESQLLKIVYKPKNVPIQRRHVGYYQDFKNIEIYYSDGEVETLQITAKILGR